MAVKVMVAPAIAQRSDSPAERSGRAPSPPRPKRRRSSVYDAEGNEVFISLICLKCHKMRPLAQFGLRRMADGAIRNQPWCRTCRGAVGANQSRRRPGEEAAADGGAAEATVSAEAATAPERIVDAGILAAQVVAALHGGRR